MSATGRGFGVFAGDSPDSRPDQADSSSLVVRSADDVNTGASAIRKKSTAAAIGKMSKFAAETIRSSSTTTSGLPWEAFSSMSSCVRA